MRQQNHRGLALLLAGLRAGLFCTMPLFTPPACLPATATAAKQRHSEALANKVGKSSIDAYGTAVDGLRHNMICGCRPLCQLLLVIGAASPFILHYPSSFTEIRGRRGLRGVTCCASTSANEVGPSPLQPSPLSCSHEDDANKLLPRLYVQGSLSKGSLINLSQEQSFYLTNVRVPCLFVLGILGIVDERGSVPVSQTQNSFEENCLRLIFR